MKIGFIGTGRMAQAIAAGLAKRASDTKRSFLGSAPTENSRRAFQQAVGDCGESTANNREVIANCEVIFLAIKPQVAREILPLLEKVETPRLFISVMAGLTTPQLESWLGAEARVVRAMPNTPALIGRGITALCGSSTSTPDDLLLAETLLQAVGSVVRVDEVQMDAVTAISGSGPAYVFHFIADLIQAGVREGLSPELARTLAVQTVSGAAAMVEQTSEQPLDLAAKVKSPKGTTLAACAVLEDRGWGAILQQAVAAARLRAEELRRGT